MTDSNPRRPTSQSKSGLEQRVKALEQYVAATASALKSEGDDAEA